MIFARIRRYGLAALLLFFLISYFPGLGSRSMLRPDEFRYAEIAREMQVTGDWTTPRFGGVRYFEKPAMGHQLNAASFTLFGENAFALRLPSALAVLLTALFLWYFLNRITRDPWLGTLAAGLYLGFGLVFGVGTFAVLDSQLTAALTIVSGCFFLAWQERKRSRKFGYLALAGIAAGAAFLLKGGLALVVPSIIAAPFLLWQKEYRQIFRYPWIPLVFALATALPWSLAIAAAEPDFWRYFLVEEHWHRFTGSTYDRDPEPFWYFIPVLLGGVLPTGLLALTVRLEKPATLLREPLVRFLLCAAVIPFLFFSVSSCKLGTYILPCFPPLAALLAIGLRRTQRRQPERFRRLLANLLRVFGFVLAAIFALALIAIALWPLLPRLPKLYAGLSIWPYLAAAVGAGWGVAMVVAARRALPAGRMLLTFFAGLALLLGLGSLAVPDAVFGDKAPEIGLRECLARIPVSPDDLIVADSRGFGSVAWLLKRSDLILTGKPGELEYGLKNYPGEYHGRFRPENEIPALIAEQPGRGLVLIAFRNLKRKPLPPEWPVKELISSHGVVVARLR